MGKKSPLSLRFLKHYGFDTSRHQDGLICERDKMIDY